MKFVGIENSETQDRLVIRAKDLKCGEIGIRSSSGRSWLLLRGEDSIIALSESGSIYDYGASEKREWAIERILKPGERVVIEA